MFTSHLFVQKYVEILDTKRAHQRFEQCLEFLESKMNPALQALRGFTFYHKSVQKSATELVELAVTDAIEEISKNDKIANETRNLVTEKLKSAKLLVMFSDEVFNLTEIDGLYSELEFLGSESLCELFVKIQIHSDKIRGRIENNWLDSNTNFVDDDFVEYFADRNILCEFKSKINDIQ